MTVKMTTAALLVGLPLLLTTGSTALSEQHIVVMLDASQSNPMIEDRRYAARLAEDLSRRIGSLALGDWITVGTFGAFSVEQNALIEKQVTTRFKPEIALRSIASLVTGFPDAVASGQVPAQGNTNVVGALEMVAHRVDCAATHVSVFVLTDGLENAEGSGEELRPPANGLFASCGSMVMMGIHAATAADTAALGDTWMAWCREAGFKDCQYQQ